MNDIEENMDNNSYNDSEQEEIYRKNPAAKLIVVSAAVIFLIAVGVIVPFIFAKNMVSDAIKQDTTQYNVSVTAVITENLVREDTSDNSGKKGKFYTPVYEYEYNGNTYSVQGRVSSSDKKYEVGQKVDVMISDTEPGKMYDPDYNSVKAIKDLGHHASGMIVLAIVLPVILMAAVTVIAIILIVRSSKKKNTADTDEENGYDPNDDYRG